MSVAHANNAADSAAAKAGTDCQGIAIPSVATDSSNKFTDSLRMQVADHGKFALSPRLAVANRQLNGLECVNIEPAALIARRTREAL